MFLRRVAAVLGLSVSVVTWGVSAAEADTAAALRFIPLGEMVVFAGEADRDLLETPALQSPALDIAISNVTDMQIRLQNARTLSDAVDFAPGVLTETRGRKVKQFSSYRGQIYPYPDYAINGVWQREFREVPYVFPAAMIQEVEVIRSAGGLLLGLTDLTGVINVVTKRYDEQTTEFQTEYGRYNTSRTAIVHGDRFEKGFYTLGLNCYSTSGPDDRNGAERTLSGVLTGGYEPCDWLKLELSLYAFTSDRELIHPEPPGMDPETWRSHEQMDPHEAIGVNLRTLFRHPDESSTEITLAHAERTEDFEGYDNRGETPIGYTHSRSKEYEHSVSIIHARHLTDDNVLRVAGYYNHWYAPEGKRFFVGQRIDTHSFALAVVDEQHIGRLTIDGGVKVMKHYHEEFTAATFDINGNSYLGNPVSDEWTDPAYSAALGLTYELSEMVDLFAHVAAGTVEAPAGGVDVSGGALEDECRLMIDAGVKLEKEDLGFLKVGVFAVQRDDAIILADPARDEFDETRYTNRDLRQFGVEAELRSRRLWDVASVYTSATVMNSLQRIDGDYDSFHEIPDCIVTAGVAAEQGPFDLNVFGKYVSRFENNRFAGDKAYHGLGNFVDLNLTAGFTFGKERNSRIYVSLENLLDDDYSTVVGYPDFGFQAFVGFQHRM